MSRQLGSIAAFAFVSWIAVSAAAQTSLPVLEPVGGPPPVEPDSCDEFACYKRAVLDGHRVAAVGWAYTGVHVFARNRSGEWVLESILPVPEPSVFDNCAPGFPDCEPTDSMEFDPDFGLGLALDGDDLLVSHVRYDEPNEIRDGRVYVFRRRGSTWTHTQTIQESCGSRSGELAIEGTTAFVGTCVFERNWFGRYRLVQSLESADGGPFGFPMAFDGRTVIFGGTNSVYVFERFRFGWRQVQKLTPIDGSTVGGFASTLAVSGNTIAVGAPETPGTDPQRPGAVHVFTRRVWGFQPSQLLDNPIPPHESDRGSARAFGTAVAVDGGHLIASGETFYPWAEPLPMNYLYRARFGRFVPAAALASGGAHSVSIDRGWALIDADGFRAGRYPTLFDLP